MAISMLSWQVATLHLNETVSPTVLLEMSMSSIGSM